MGPTICIVEVIKIIHFGLQNCGDNVVQKFPVIWQRQKVILFARLSPRHTFGNYTL